MGLVIGFGSAEKAFEEAEEFAIREFVASSYKEMGCEYITPELTRRVDDWCKERAQRYQQKADEYRDAADHPDRYSRYWATVLDNASHIVVILTFHHINRRHALSPDGWGMMEAERLVHIRSSDFR